MENRSSSKLSAIIAVVILVVVVVGALAAYSVVSSSAQSGSEASSAAFSRSSASASAAVESSATSSASTTVQTDAASSSQAAEETASGWDNSVLGLIAFEDADGNEVTLADIANGRITVINVWATWCPYCVDEMQDFQGLYDKYGADVQFIMLNAADSKSEVTQAHAYVKDEGFTFPVYYDVAWTVQRLFSVRAYPTTIVIDVDGSIIYNAAGRINTQSFDAGLASLLG